jgi:hypothetical protein
VCHHAPSISTFRTLPRVSHVTGTLRKVGVRRTAARCFPTPPSEPCMRLSPHPALRGLASRFNTAVIGFLSSKQLISRAPLGLHQVISDYFVRRMSISWRPSPCRRLSRPPSTMTPPTLWDVIGGLLTFASIPEPPTFTTMYSTDARRWELMIDPSRSSRNPDQSAGTSGLPPISFGLPHMLRPPRSSFGARNAIGCGRCPIVQGLEAGGAFPVGLSFLCLLTICVLSQAGPLGGLHRASPVPFRGSSFSKVGAERVCSSARFPTPPSEPCMRLSPHTALRR